MQQSRAKRRNKKQKGRTSKIILICMGIFLLTFIIVCLWLFYVTGSEPTGLIAGTFAICGGECSVLGWIKTTKERQLERLFELEDRDLNA